MYDDEQRRWLAGQDYEMAAELRATEQQPAGPAPAPPDEAPDRLPSRDALLGDLDTGPSLALLDRFGRTRHVKDDDPPGTPWHGSPR